MVLIAGFITFSHRLSNSVLKLIATNTLLSRGNGGNKLKKLRGYMVRVISYIFRVLIFYGVDNDKLSYAKNQSPNPNSQLFYLRQDDACRALPPSRRQRFVSAESLLGRCARCRCNAPSQNINRGKRYGTRIARMTRMHADQIICVPLKKKIQNVLPYIYSDWIDRIYRICH